VLKNNNNILAIGKELMIQLAASSTNTRFNQEIKALAAIYKTWS
jgi:hypothetical protein